MVENLGALCAELLKRYTHNLDERLVIYVEIIFSENSKKGDFSITAGRGCDTKILLTFTLCSNFILVFLLSFAISYTQIIK